MSIPFDSAITGSVPEQAEKPGREPAIVDRNLDTLRNPNGAVSAVFYEELAPQATRYAMSILRSWNDAEEVVQESFCRLVASRRSEKPIQLQQCSTGESGNKAVLFATVRNLSIDWLRKQSRRKFDRFDAGQIASNPSNTHAGRLEQLETGVQAVLKEMPSQWADALQLKMNGDLSYGEISQVLEATHGQVRTWIYRARQQLAKELKRLGLLDDGNKNE